MPNTHTQPRRIRLEPCLQTRPSIMGNGEIDGELYTERWTRGNIRGYVVGTGERLVLHPFKRTALGDSPLFSALPSGFYIPSGTRSIGEYEDGEPYTLVTYELPCQ